MANEGLSAGWHLRVPSGAVPVTVPGVVQQVFPDHQGVAWYWAEVPPLDIPPEHRAYLRFTSVDYVARVWLDGHEIGAHEGGGMPFELDATDIISPGRPSLVAVRVVTPTSVPIDGLLLAEVPHSNRLVPEQFKPGWGFNTGGITGEVVVHVEPTARLLDVFVRARAATGALEVDAFLPDLRLPEDQICLSVLVSEQNNGHHVVDGRWTEGLANVGPEGGPARITLQIPLEQLRYWDVDDPFLYSVRVRLDRGGSVLTSHERTVRVGFRELRVRNGWFELNGRRIYLRSTHTGNHHPIAHTSSRGPQLIRQDLVYAKAAGFNTVRFIAGPATEEQLDLCDELGLMVYEETRASWLLGNSPRMGEHFDRSFDELVRRDRNHPSVVVWGLLNETFDGPVFRHAVGYLQRLRELDDTRLVLLSSGRWDGDIAIGSVSNPGELTWSHEWGSEQEGGNPVTVGWSGDPDRGAFVAGAGDLHLYPSLPESPNARRLLRTMGSGTKPVFLSEYGVGSLFDAVTALAESESERGLAGAVGARPEPPDTAYIRNMAERFLSDWETFDMQELYCFPEDVFTVSQRNQSAHRAATFDLIRSNPDIAGYNLTGMLDHALTGEGAWTFGRRWKPGAMEATSQGWAPLRWCLTVTPSVVFRGDCVDLDITLANEDALAPGPYRADVAIVGPEGWRWQRSVNLTVQAGRGPLALPVFEGRVSLDGPPGTYHCAASLGTAASPQAGRATIELLPAQARALPRARLGVRGAPPGAMEWLQSNALSVEDRIGLPSAMDLLLVGHAGEIGEADRRGIARFLDGGGTVVLLCPWELVDASNGPNALSVAPEIACSSFHDWLYHKECFTRHPGLVDGLRGPGLMDWDFYGPVLPRHILHGAPSHVAAFAIAVGFPCESGYASGLVAGTFPRGPGRLVVSTFDLLRHIGSLAVADVLAANLLRYAWQDAS